MSNEFDIVRATGAVLGVGFAALWVWLGMRIINRRERWGKRAALRIGVGLVLYAVSLGPACALCDKLGNPDWFRDPLGFVFFPLALAAQFGPRWVNDAISAYVQWWIHLSVARR